MDSDICFTVVDVETTGGRFKTDKIIEVGAVRVHKGKITDSFSSLVNPGPGIHIPPFVTWITSITNTMVQSAPAFAYIAASFRTFIGESVFVAHNVQFDYSFVNAEFVQAGVAPMANEMLCTIQMARKNFPGLLHYNLVDLCKTLKIPHVRAHRALNDSIAAAQVLLKILQKKEAVHAYQAARIGRGPCKDDSEALTLRHFS